MERLCLACAGDNAIQIYDADLNKTALFKVKGAGSPGPRRLSIFNAHIYVINSGDGSVSRISAQTGEETARQICAYPTGIVPLKQPGFFAVSCGETDRIYIIDEKLNLIESMGCKSYPLGLSLSADGTQFLCACLSSRKVKHYDAQSLVFKHETEVEGYPYFAAMDSNGRLFAAYSGESFEADGHLAVYNAKGEKQALIPAGRMPTTICTDEPGGRLYFANTGNKSVDIVDLHTLKKTGAIQAGGMPDDICLFKEHVFISCMMEDVLIKADKSGRIVKTVHTGREPRGMGRLGE